MRNLDKTSRTTSYLEKMFKELNARFFNGEVIEPIITIQSTKKAYGHVTTSKIWKSKEKQLHELNIGAGTLDRPIEAIAGTMVHEMVHLLNMQNGVQDCSRGNTYHNKNFKTEAEKHGIRIEYAKSIGWSVTTPKQELIDFVRCSGWNDIQMTRQEQSENKEKRPKAKSSTRKYECPCCGLSVRATKVVFVKCIECDEQLLEI